MKPKTWIVLHWTVTALFALAMLMAGLVEVLRSAEGQEIMRHLGYPGYVLTIIGTGKIVGALALLQPRFRTLKEWAYAGFTVNFLGAAASRAYGGDSLALIVSPLIFWAVMFASYFLWQKVERLKKAKLTAELSSGPDHLPTPAVASGQPAFA